MEVGVALLLDVIGNVGMEKCCVQALNETFKRSIFSQPWQLAIEPLNNYVLNRISEIVRVVWFWNIV